MKQSRLAGPVRRAMLQKSLMRFIDDEEPNDAIDFVGRPVDDVPASEREVVRAITALRDEGFIKGVAYFGTGFARPELTPRGIEAADESLASRSSIPEGGTTNYNTRNTIENYGNINSAAAGNQVTQSGNTMHVGGSMELATTLAELKSRLSAIADTPANATAAIEAMDKECSSSEPDKSRLQHMYSVFMTAIATKLADQAFAGIGELSAQLGTIITG